MNGVSTLKAEPSILCTTTDPTFRRMRIVSSLSLVLYGFGLPLLFVWVLRTHRNAVFFDQLLRVRGEGESALTNPYIHIRRRFRKLYEDFTPNCKYWRVVLISRKLGLAMIGILLAGDAATQVRAVCQIFVRSITTVCGHADVCGSENVATDSDPECSPALV
jgi:hypothetical protein